MRKSFIKSVVIGLLIVIMSLNIFGCSSSKSTGKNTSSKNATSVKNNKKIDPRESLFNSILSKISSKDEDYFNELEFVDYYNSLDQFDYGTVERNPEEYINSEFSIAGVVQMVVSENGTSQYLGISQSTGDEDSYIDLRYDRNSAICNGERLVEDDEILATFLFLGVDESGTLYGEITSVETYDRGAAAMRISEGYNNAGIEITGIEFCKEDSFVLPFDNYGYQYKSYNEDNVVNDNIVYSTSTGNVYLYPKGEIVDGTIFTTLDGQEVTYDYAQTQEWINGYKYEEDDTDYYDDEYDY